jgi:ATP-binding protein involved in chromosome partitioning
MGNESKCNTCDDKQCDGKQQYPGENEEEFLERQALRSRMCGIRHKVIVLSGKGGVGKSTVAANLAASLCMAGKTVGLLDIDIHGPSIPKLLHIEHVQVRGTENSIYPVDVGNGLKVMSLGLLLSERDDAIIWRGPMKHGVIKQLLRDVEWGDLDYLVVDSPPGTGDEPMSVIQLIGDADGAVIVTTPQELAVQDVRRSIMFCRKLDLPILGVVENMSGFRCPQCQTHTRIFGSGGGQNMAEKVGVPFLGAIPIDPEVVTSGDTGVPFVQAQPHAETSRAFARIVRPLLERDLPIERTQPTIPRGQPLKVAIPVAQGVLCVHFGHSEQFVLFNVDPGTRAILDRQALTPPPHEPGVLPRWLHQQGANLIITGGMGARAQSLFAENGIDVIVGAASGVPEQVVRAYLDGTLQRGANICDH